MWKFKKKKENKEEQFDYINFLTQIAICDRRKHLLSESEVNRYFLSRIDREKYHIGFCYSICVGRYIDDYNWEVYVYEKITDENGRLTDEYYSDKNIALVNSRYMNEYELYNALYKLGGDNGENR